jgi:membrane protein YqaA with SNARE-associated domain
LLGYAIGYYFFQAIEPHLLDWGYGDKLALLKGWFDEYGIWAVLIAGFSPVPYKLFTVSAGAMSLALGPFILASLAGRGARFFIVAGLMKTLGPVAEAKLKPYMDRLGWALVAGIVIYLVVRSAV